MTDQKIENILKGTFPFWDKISHEEKQFITSHTKSIQYKKGENVHNNKGCSGVFMVRSGDDTIKLTHEQIAKYIGSAREVVLRMIKYFSNEGIVQVSRKGVKIISKKRLRDLTL